VKLSALRIKTSRCSVGFHSSLSLQKIFFCKFKKIWIHSWIRWTK